jgi:hypothetical protein
MEDWSHGNDRAARPRSIPATQTRYSTASIHAGGDHGYRQTISEYHTGNDNAI